MLNKVEETIDGTEFSTKQFAAVQGFTLLAKLTRVAAPIVAELGRMKDGEEDLELFRVIGKALETMPAEEFTALALEVLKGTSAVVEDARGKRVIDLVNKENVERVFNGRLMTMVKVLVHAIKANYADFITGGELLAPLDLKTSESSEP